MSSIVLHWFLPTSGDSRTVIPFGPDGHRRPPRIEYLTQIARAADDLGFTGVLTPTGTWCEDSWIVTSTLLAQTRDLEFLVAFRPNAIAPTLAAQQAATFQRISGGRLLLNIVSGGDDREQRRFGDWLDHDERYDRTDEFLHVLRGALSGTPFDFAGRYFHVEGATVNQVPDPQPRLYFGGASSAAEIVAARHVDVYLAWGEPPDLLAPRVARVRALAADRIEELHELGFDEFIFSGHPHLEEAYQFGEGVMPLLRSRGRIPQLARRSGEADSVLGRHAVTNPR